MQRIFPDINNFTSRFEAHAAATAGALLVGILATDGTGFVSPTYAEQAAHAHEAGLPVWHYHFCRPERHPDGAGEAGHFWTTARPHYHRGDRLVYDVERLPPPGLSRTAQLAELRAYVRRVDAMLHEISGIHSVLYMPDSLFRDCGPGLQWLSREAWIASWGGKVKRLGAGRKMIAQQISNGQEGSQPFRFAGIGPCDTNRLQFWYARRLARDRARGHRHG